MAIALKVLIGVFTLLLAALGAQWMFSPESVASQSGMTLGSAVALNTARGDIGGFLIMSAAFGALGLATGERRWLQSLALAMGCVALGRIVGLVSDGFEAANIPPLGIEIFMVGTLLLAARTPSDA